MAPAIRKQFARALLSDSTRAKHVEVLFLLLGFTIGSLLAILCLLTGRATTVSTRYVLFLLGFGLHLVVVILLRTTAAFEDHTAHDNIVNVTHIL